MGAEPAGSVMARFPVSSGLLVSFGATFEAVYQLLAFAASLCILYAADGDDQLCSRPLFLWLGAYTLAMAAQCVMHVMLVVVVFRAVHTSDEAARARSMAALSASSLWRANYRTSYALALWDAMGLFVLMGSALCSTPINPLSPPLRQAALLFAALLVVRRGLYAALYYRMFLRRPLRGRLSTGARAAILGSAPQFVFL